MIDDNLGVTLEGRALRYIFLKQQNPNVIAS